MPEIPSTIPFMPDAVTNSTHLFFEKLSHYHLWFFQLLLTCPFVSPKQSPKTMKQLYMTSFSVISGIIIFGGLIAPVVSTCVTLWLHLPIIFTRISYQYQVIYQVFLKRCLLMQLELKLGLGGTSYEDFIRTLHLPLQLRCFEEPISYSELMWQYLENCLIHFCWLCCSVRQILQWHHFQVAQLVLSQL